jgi:pimeloyl-ACP methyl ester carboxylesterase
MENAKALPFARSSSTVFKSTGSLTRRICAAIVLVVLLFVISQISRPDAAYMLNYPHWTKAPKNYGRWDEIPPSSDLTYYPCFQSQQCARLEVPLDWNATSSDPMYGINATIAIMKLPAKVPVTHPHYAGPLLWNPGGPGGPATMSHEFLAPLFQSMVDTAGSKYYDVISFDPRGVANTEPRPEGILDPIMRESWMEKMTAVGYDFSDERTFDNMWARKKLYGRLLSSSSSSAMTAFEAEGDGDAAVKDEAISPVRFLSTANVVRDMVEIIEQHGKWREKDAFNLLYRSKSSIGHGTPKDIIERTRHRPGEEGLNYWGLSYGTIIGQTFASLQPHRVQRMLLDGVVDGADYSAGSWLKMLQDTDAITAAFAETCIAAGKTRCPIADWAEKDEPGKLLTKIYTLLEDLKHDPFPFLNPDTGMPSLITYSDIRGLLFQIWYIPILFPFAAQILDSIAQRNASIIFGLKPPFTCNFPDVFLPDQAASGAAIMCTDAKDLSNTTKTEYAEYMRQLRLQSPLFTDVLATVRMPCHGLAARPRWRFTGPYGAKTANPILFADQSLDPITPLRNAEKAATLFPGAGVLEAEGWGHSTLAMPNVCAALRIKKYFEDGKTEGEKVVCPRMADPWAMESLGLSGELEAWSDEEREMWTIGRKAQDGWVRMKKEMWELGLWI